MVTEYIAVAQSRTGKVEDLAICNSLALARRYADDFARIAPPHAVITIFKAEPIEKQAGKAQE
jgi:hypothetical protein